MVENNNERILTVEELSKMSAFQCLWECNKNHLDEVAITFRADVNVKDRNKRVLATKITYNDLFNNIVKTYNSLKNMGVKKGDIITYASITTPELIYTFYASNILGSIMTVIDPRETSENLATHFLEKPSKLYFAPEKFFDNTKKIYKDIDVDKIITMSFTESLPLPVKMAASVLNKKNGVEPFKAPKSDIFTDWKKFSYKNDNKPKDFLDNMNHFEKDTVISLSHTTGTTGKPKTILHTNENWNAQYYNITNSDLKFVRGENFLNVTVPWVDFGLINAVHAFLCNGIRLDLDVMWSPETHADFYIKSRPDWCMGAPGWFDPLFTNELYQDEIFNYGRYIITGGAPLFAHKQKLYNDRLIKDGNCRVIPGYGLSEVTAAAFLDTQNITGTLGYPMPLFEYKIVNPNTLEEVTKGESGELYLRSKYSELSPLAKGYLNNEEETNKNFTVDSEGHRWVRTGDKVHLDLENNSVVWESRYKNILTYNGFNINCDKLLDAVEKVKGVGKAAIIGAITGDGNQRPVICVELPLEYNLDDFEFVKSDILRMINEKFADYYEPLDIVLYDLLPTKTMKINYKQLKLDNLNEFGEYIKSNTLKRGIVES